jgi:hypothetical protein
VVHGVDAIERAVDCGAVAHVAYLKLRLGTEMRGFTVLVNLRHERVENAHAVSSRDEGVEEMRAVESRSARDEDIQLFQGSSP